MYALGGRLVGVERACSRTRGSRTAPARRRRCAARPARLGRVRLASPRPTTCGAEQTSGSSPASQQRRRRAASRATTPPGRPRAAPTRQPRLRSRSRAPVGLRLRAAARRLGTARRRSGGDGASAAGCASAAARSVGRRGRRRRRVGRPDLSPGAPLAAMPAVVARVRGGGALLVTRPSIRVKSSTSHSPSTLTRSTCQRKCRTAPPGRCGSCWASATTSTSRRVGVDRSTPTSGISSRSRAPRPSEDSCCCSIPETTSLARLGRTRPGTSSRATGETWSIDHLGHVARRCRCSAVSAKRWRGGAHGAPRPAHVRRRHRTSPPSHTATPPPATSDDRARARRARSRRPVARRRAEAAGPDPVMVLDHASGSRVGSGRWAGARSLLAARAAGGATTSTTPFRRRCRTARGTSTRSDGPGRCRCTFPVSAIVRRDRRHRARRDRRAFWAPRALVSPRRLGAPRVLVHRLVVAASCGGAVSVPW